MSSTKTLKAKPSGFKAEPSPPPTPAYSSSETSQKAKAGSKSKEAKDAKEKQHKRSRTGCFTCRLRRKKCDETTPVCRGCRHLGIECEYKRPGWWSHAEKRKTHKELIKGIIRETMLNERPQRSATTAPMHNSASSSANVYTPPGLCHSVPTPDTANTRAASLDSHFSPQFGFENPHFFDSTPLMPAPQWTPIPGPMSHFSPYEVDVKTEHQTFVNDLPTEKESFISTFSILQTPGATHPFGADQWIQHEYFESLNESFVEEPLDFNFFNFAREPGTPSRQAVIQVDEADQPLLDHFIDKVAHHVFPILDVNQHGSTRSDVILPALESNKCYLHCCLSVAALHRKVTEHLAGEQIDNQIMVHRYQAIAELCEAFKANVDHSKILEATLGMIFFQSSVGKPDDSLPDIPWHQHFQAVPDLLHRIELETPPMSVNSHVQRSFNVALASWFDILGATMLRRVPVFAATYRDKSEAGQATGLAELMGCDDQIMYLISEIACLDQLKSQGMDDMMLCTYITNLGESLTATESTSADPAPVLSCSGAIRPKQLSANITTIFRLAARIYLCSLVPDFDRHRPAIMALVDSVTQAMAFVPAGPDGFDRSLVWPLLVAGSVALPFSPFRSLFEQRAAQLGSAAGFGAFGRAAEVLRDVWATNDAHFLDTGDKLGVHWRDVVAQKQWDFLLI